MLVFCDLDDTVFAPQTFSVEAEARRALDRLKRGHVALVFCSSKTRAELELIHQELGINHPFICENGAAVFVPRGYFGFSVPQAIEVAGYEVVQFGKPYAEVVASLHRAVDRLGMEVVGFSDMSVEEVATECDLPLLQARLAKLREYTEPFRVVDAKPGAITRLTRALRSAGHDCTSRGRYYHVGTIRHHIGGQYLRSLYWRAFGDVVSVGFADHTSAVPLPRQAGVPLIARSDQADETTCLLADVPAARLSDADSVGAWVNVIREIAAAAGHRRSSASL